MTSPLLTVISLFRLDLSTHQSVLFVAPTLDNIPFGMGYVIVLLALLNYVIDVCGIYAATTGQSLDAIIPPLAAALS